MSGDNPKNSIIENEQNTEKSPGDLRRLAVTQAPNELKKKNNNNIDLAKKLKTRGTWKWQ